MADPPDPASIVGVIILSRKLRRGNVVSSPMVRHLCVLLAAGTLSGCGWFDGWFSGKPSPLQSEPLRAGVDRQTTANGLPPAPTRGSYDASVAPVDDNRNRPIGAIVATKGGQKAQIEASDKERTKQEAEREKERVQREAERDRVKKEEEAGKGASPAPPPPSDQAPPSEQAPAPAPAPTPAPLPAPTAEPGSSPPPTER
jgi:hypothetical protein